MPRRRAQGDGDGRGLDARQRAVLNIRRQHHPSLGRLRECGRQGKRLAGFPEMRTRVLNLVRGVRYRWYLSANSFLSSLRYTQRRRAREGVPPTASAATPPPPRPGRASAVSVSAYCDRNNSGAFTDVIIRAYHMRPTGGQQHLIFAGPF